MEASEGDLTGRGYGAVLWEPDDKTVRGARVTRTVCSLILTACSQMTSAPSAGRSCTAWTCGRVTIFGVNSIRLFKACN